MDRTREAAIRAREIYRFALKYGKDAALKTYLISNRRLHTIMRKHGYSLPKKEERSSSFKSLLQ